MDFTLSTLLMERSVRHLCFCLKMGPENTRADEATGPGPQQALKQDVPYATATPSPPSSSRTRTAPVPPMQRDPCHTTEAASSPKLGCEYTRRENRLPSSPGKGRLPNIFFLNYYLGPSEAARVPSAIQPPRLGPPAADQTCYSCQEKVCCGKGGEIRKSAASASLWTSR